MVASVAPYELMTGLLAGESPPTALAARAFAAPPELWKRALTLEACAVQFDRALRRSALADAAPSCLRDDLAFSTATAVAQALRVPGQVTELAEIARELGIQVILLKGAARLLGGEMAGTRSVSDIDVLARPVDARRLHASLQERCGYHSLTSSPEHHLPTLLRPGALPVEIHVQLGPTASRLDERIRRDAREGTGPAKGALLPAATALLLHALEHALLVHWAVRYRLRDILDVAELWNADVDAAEVAHFVRGRFRPAALDILISAARRFNTEVPFDRPGAWRVVGRVARTRHLIAGLVRNSALAKSLCIAGGVLAEGSPRALLRPAALAVFGVQQARAL
ncbi:MAG: nucleotidyltransferase family protein [Gemmatimonadaceae bacterium]